MYLPKNLSYFLIDFKYYVNSARKLVIHFSNYYGLNLSFTLITLSNSANLSR